MRTITFDVPEGALPELRLSPTEFVKVMRVAAALPCYSHGEPPNRKRPRSPAGAERSFIDELAHRRIPVAHVTTKELQNEACAPHCRDLYG